MLIKLLFSSDLYKMLAETIIDLAPLLEKNKPMANVKKAMLPLESAFRKLINIS